MTKRGHVSLVGAGPGDPALLTRKAAIALRRADLVLYDALVDERVVALARGAPSASMSGKRAGRHALSQHEIQAVLVNQAKRGRRIVRLKGGDPFVFGRGGEEAQALERAGHLVRRRPRCEQRDRRTGERRHSAHTPRSRIGIPRRQRTRRAGVRLHHQRAEAERRDGGDPDGLRASRRTDRSPAGSRMGRGRRPRPSSRTERCRPSRPGAGRSAIWPQGARSLESDGPAMIVIGAVAALELQRSPHIGRSLGCGSRDSDGTAGARAPAGHITRKHVSRSGHVPAAAWGRR